MGHFRFVRGRGGARKVSQVPTGEEPHLQEKKDEDEELNEAASEIGIEAPTNPERQQRVLMPDDPSAGFKKLLNGLYKQSIPWAEKYIEKLETLEEVEAIRHKEVTHPKYEGGRTGVHKALNEKADEIDENRKKPERTEVDADEVVVLDEDAEIEDENTEPEVPETDMPEAADTYDCPKCDFSAGSAAGLEAHVFSNHDVDL